jgi:hypothetical protein
MSDQSPPNMKNCPEQPRPAAANILGKGAKKTRKKPYNRETEPAHVLPRFTV